MLRLASDEDVSGALVRGLLRRMPDIDLVRAQDGLYESATDAEVLDWAAATNRALITNDRSTMVGLVRHRATIGEPLPGVIVSTNRQSIGSAIEDILLIATCLSDQELKSQILVFLPLLHAH